MQEKKYVGLFRTVEAGQISINGRITPTVSICVDISLSVASNPVSMTMGRTFSGRPAEGRNGITTVTCNDIDKLEYHM